MYLSGGVKEPGGVLIGAALVADCHAVRFCTVLKYSEVSGHQAAALVVKKLEGIVEDRTARALAETKELNERLERAGSTKTAEQNAKALDPVKAPVLFYAHELREAELVVELAQLALVEDEVDSTFCVGHAAEASPGHALVITRLEPR